MKSLFSNDLFTVSNIKHWQRPLTFKLYLLISLTIPERQTLGSISKQDFSYARSASELTDFAMHQWRCMKRLIFIQLIFIRFKEKISWIRDDKVYVILLRCRYYWNCIFGNLSGLLRCLLNFSTQFLFVNLNHSPSLDTCNRSNGTMGEHNK